MANIQTNFQNVKANESGSNIFVSKFQDSVWFSVSLNHGNASCTLNKESAEQLIKLLQEIVVDLADSKESV